MYRLRVIGVAIWLVVFGMIRPELALKILGSELNKRGLNNDGE